jgi:hypothetical protein
VVALKGLNPVTLEAGTSYADAGATASDIEDGTLAPMLVSNTVESNVVGTYGVTWQATDSGGNIGTTTRTVYVVDTTAPVVTPPANVLVNATGAGGMAVNYPAATATDVVGVTGISYSQPSGSVFASGTTTVTVTATDAAGNTGTASFTVTVNAPPAGGNLAVTPGSGVQQGDTVHLSATGWSDAQVPLSYQFFLGTNALGTAGSASTFDLVAPAPGTYTTRVRVTDALGAFVETTQPLTVVPGIASWRQTYFGTTSNTGAAADLADPNRNGVVNLLEYAFHGDPATPATGASMAPAMGRSAANALQITFVRYLDRADLRLVVVGADSPSGPWIDLATSVAGEAFTPAIEGATAEETGSGESRTVTVTDLYPIGDPDHPQRYLGLKVVR